MTTLLLDGGPVAAPSRADETPQAAARSRRYLPALLGLLFFGAYAAVGVLRHRQLKTGGYDLGIFEQAVRSYAELRLPVSEIKGPGFPLLGDHFHPILALLAPFYRVFPSPLTLIVAQAALIALSILPITRLAVARLGTRLGLLVGLSYALSWGLQRAVAFEFHEICFAVPLLAFSLTRLAERRWRSAVLFAAPLVLVKEDLPLTVAAIGFCLFLAGRRRLGAAVAVGGVAAAALLMLVVIPALNVNGVNPYLSSVDSTTVDPLARLVQPLDIKTGTLLALLAPTCLLALRSPLVVIAVPTLLWRFWSTTPNYWGTHFHYDAVLMPIMFVAFLDALHRLRPRLTGGLRRVPAVAVAAGLVITLFLGHGLAVSKLVRPSTWHTDKRASAVRELLSRIPDGATVAAPNMLAAQLTNRTTVYLFPPFPDAQVRTEWVVTDAPVTAWPLTDEQAAAKFEALTATGAYRQVDAGAGLLLFRRN